MASEISNKIFSTEKLKRWTRQIHAKVSASHELRCINDTHVSSRGLTKTDIFEKIDKFGECCEFVEIGKNGNDYVIADANYCKNESFCPQCASRVQTRRRARYADPILQKSRAVASGELYAYMITLTIKAGDSLAERLDALNNARRAMRRMGQRRKNGRSVGEFGKIESALCAIEAKRGDNSGQWHVHNHILAFCDAPLDYAIYDQDAFKELKKRFGDRVPANELEKIELPGTRQLYGDRVVKTSKISREWIRATGGESLNIQCDPIRHVPRSAKGQKRKKFAEMPFEDSVFEQSKEIFKYMTKLDKNESGDIIEIIDAMYNRRKFDAYGDFRSIDAGEYEREECEVSYLMRFSDDLQQYLSSGEGKIRTIEQNEIAERARKKSGIALGEYRRQRRYILDQKNRLGNQLSICLDMAKQAYRQQISVIWTEYKSFVSRRERYTYRGCDKYNPLIALAGKFIPGSDSKTAYQLAF